MADKDIFKDIFSDKLKDIELPVSDKVWSAVSKQIPSVATVANSGMSLVTKIIIGTTITASTIVGGILLTNDSNNETIKDTKNTSQNSATTHSTIKNEVTNESIEKNELISPIIVSKAPIVVEDTFMVSSNPPFIVQEANSPIEETNFTNKETKLVTSSNPFVDNKKVEEIKETKSETVKPLENTSTEKVVESKSIQLPNVFSPNNDGQNDYLLINTEEEFSEFSVVILDKNNQKVYQSNEPTFKWDGVDLNGNVVSQGQYVYYITGKTKSGQLVNKYSSLYIQR